MAESAEEPAIRQNMRTLLVGTWATGALFLLATPAPYRLKLPLMAVFVAVQISNIAQASWLRKYRLTAPGPSTNPVRRWRQDAALAEWPPALTVGLSFASIAMLLAGGVITFLGGAST